MTRDYSKHPILGKCLEVLTTEEMDAKAKAAGVNPLTPTVRGIWAKQQGYEYRQYMINKVLNYYYIKY